MPFKRGPDEEGIETLNALTSLHSRTPFKRGPDEEGIETNRETASARPHRSNAGLMKKGLRPLGRFAVSPQSGSNADLMKKGLRRTVLTSLPSTKFKRGPDEEGSETSNPVENETGHLFKRGPDEEGICT